MSLDGWKGEEKSNYDNAKKECSNPIIIDLLYLTQD
jgi:hypothetical protein